MPNRSLERFFLLLILLVMARHVWVSAFIHPYLDDFGYAVAGMQQGLAERLAHEHAHWNGRWASNILVLRGPLVLGIERGLPLYRLVPVLLMTFTATGAYVLLRTALRSDLTKQQSWLVTFLFLAVFIHLMPHAGEGFYWYTGAVSYQLPNALLLFLMAALLRLWSSDDGGSRWWVIPVCMLLSLIIAGTTEVHMAIVVSTHALLLFLRWRSKLRLEYTWVVLFLWSLLCALPMLLAPGNAARGALFAERHEVFRTLAMSTAQTGRFTGWWMLSPALIVMSLLFLRWYRKFPIRDLPLYRWMTPLLPFVAVFLVMVPPYWATGMLGQHRTVNVALFLFLPLWFLALAVCDHCWFRPRGWRIPWSGARQWPWAMGLLCAFLLYARHDSQVTRELLDGTLRDHDAHLEKRYEMIQEAVSENAVELVVLPLPGPTQSLRPLDIGPDPEGHWNRVLAAYFGNDTLRITVREQQ